MPCAQDDDNDTGRTGNRFNVVNAMSVPMQASANTDAKTTSRRDAESAASIGRITSQTVAKDEIPPVESAIVITRPASASDDSMCAHS